jgi:hypothetical protein
LGRSLPRRVASATAANHRLHLKPIGAHRSFDLERRHARILANRALVIVRHVDIGGDDGGGCEDFVLVARW